MKKIISMLVCLVLLSTMVVSASAASYVQFSRLKRLTKAAADKEVTELELAGDPALVIKYENNKESAWSVFVIEGKRAHIISYLLITPDNAFESADLERALLACNTWNDDYRFPRLYLNVEAKRFVADGFLFCTEDVTDDMITEFVDNQIFGTKQLFEFLAEQGFTVFLDME